MAIIDPGLIPVLCYIFWGTQHRLLREQEIVFDHYQKWVGSWYVNATLYKATGGIIMLMKYVRSMSVIGKPRERERIWMKDILRDCSMTYRTNSEFLFNHLNEEITQFCFTISFDHQNSLCLVWFLLPFREFIWVNLIDVDLWPIRTCRQCWCRILGYYLIHVLLH